MKAIIFTAAGNYLTEINRWGSEDESGCPLEAVLLTPPEAAPISYFNAFQTPAMVANDKEDEEVLEDNDEEDEDDWDDDEDEDDDWDDEDEEDEDWDDEDEDWDDDEDEDEDEE